MDDEKKYQIEIVAIAHYLAEQSDPATSHYMFAYSIRVLNIGRVAAQLISRHWIITDSEGHVQEIHGLGVVGNQPVLKPGESFEYTSGCQLATPVGTMRGTYQMVADDGVEFEAPIAEFLLSMPRILH